MIPVRELEKVLMHDRETVTPIWEHIKTPLISERDTCGLFVTFITDISRFLAYHVVVPSRHIRNALQVVIFGTMLCNEILQKDASKRYVRTRELTCGKCFVKQAYK